jgi:hypothetical protein
VVQTIGEGVGYIVGQEVVEVTGGRKIAYKEGQRGRDSG